MTDVVLAEPAAEQRPGVPSRPARHRGLASAVRTIPYLVIVGYLLVALLGGWFVDYDPLTTAVTDRLLPPGSTRGDGTTAWLGTDAVGRDVLAQVVLGARTSVTIAVFTVLVCGVLGVALGLLAGYLGGWVDTSVARTIDILVAFPGILLAIVVAGLFHRGYLTVIIALAVAGWIGFARVVRGVAMSLRERDWVDAARVMAVSRVGILTRHVLPFVVGPVVAMATLEFALVVLAEAGLSFLGIGLPPTAVSWGQTVASGKDYLETAWWISAFPGLALAVLVISVGLVGDQLTARYGGGRRYR